jgi:hypothetical protein
LIEEVDVDLAEVVVELGGHGHGPYLHIVLLVSAMVAIFQPASVFTS